MIFPDPSVTSFRGVRTTLRARLEEAPPTRIQLLVGPRQVGKTTLLLELAAEWKERAVYVSADAPEAVLPHWREGIWRRALDVASGGNRGVLLLDEVQHLPDWSRWLKARFDEAKRQSIPLHIVASGSSSLQLGTGARETMAGRFERLTLGHWSAADLAALAGIPDREAARRLVTLGGYPGAVPLWDDPVRCQAYVRDSIIEPAIGRDILSLEQIRKPALLRQIFAIAAAAPASILSLDKIAGLLAEKGALETISHYLHLLQEAFLVGPLPKYSGHEARRRRAPSKLVMLNNALLAAVGTTAPDPATDPQRWGRWVENACLARAVNTGLAVHYWREEPWEVDAVVATPGDGGWLIEIKTGPYTAEDLRGLSHAARKFPTMRPLVLCDEGTEAAARQAGFDTMPWPEFLL